MATPFETLKKVTNSYIYGTMCHVNLSILNDNIYKFNSYDYWVIGINNKKYYMGFNENYIRFIITDKYADFSKLTWGTNNYPEHFSINKDNVLILKDPIKTGDIETNKISFRLIDGKIPSGYM